MANQSIANQEGSGYERLGAAKLSLWDCIAQSVGFIGPVFSTAFVFPLLMGVLSASGKGAGVAAPLAVLISAVGIFALGWIVAQYAKRIHAAGSLYDYVSNGLGSTLGSAAGWLYYGGAIALTVGLGVFIGGFIHDTILTEFNKEPLPVWAWNVIWAVVLFFVLYLGVKLSTRLQLGLALVSMLVLLAFNIYVIAKVGSGNDLGKAFDPSGSTTGNLSGVLFGVLYGLLIFVGFETAANLAEETSQPKRQIPRAVLLSVAIVSVFYLIGSYTQVAGFHFSLETFSTPDVFLAPVFALGGQYSSTGTVRLLELIVLLDMMAVGIGAAVASTRGVFAMSRDRRLPGILAKVSGRFGTPAGAIVFLMVIQALLIWATQAWTSLFALPDTPHYAAIFGWMSTFGAFALVVVYLMMSIGALVGLQDHPNRVGLWIAALLGIAVTGGAVYGAFYQVKSPTLLAPMYAAVLFVIGLIAALLFKGRQPARIALPELRTHQE
jgi:amino acid transporter